MEEVVNKRLYKRKYIRKDGEIAEWTQTINYVCKKKERLTDSDKDLIRKYRSMLVPYKFISQTIGKSYYTIKQYCAELEKEKINGVINKVVDEIKEREAIIDYDLNAIVDAIINESGDNILSEDGEIDYSSFV